MTCRTLHPDPQRLLTLGEAARAAGVSHLALRRSVQDGSLVTLPALHLGQRIRLVEAEALLAAYPEAQCAGRPPLDPDHRGIEWIGATPDDEPPQGATPVLVPRSEEPPYELPRASSVAPRPMGTAGASLPGSAPAPDPQVTTQPASSSMAPSPQDGLDGLVSAGFGGSARAAATQDEPAPRPGRTASGETATTALAAVEVAEPQRDADSLRPEAAKPVAVRPEVTAQPERLAPEHLPAPESGIPEPQVAAVTPDSEAPDREPAAEPVLSPVPSSDTPLTGSVERWESGRRRRARMVQGALTAWAVLLVAAWVQFEAEGQGTVQAAGWAGADNGSEAAPEDRSVSGTVVRPVEASATAPDRSPEQSPVVVEPRVAADAGESTPGTLAVGAPLAAAGVEDSSGVSAAGPSSAGGAAPAPAVEAVPESASAQPTEAVDAAVTSATPEPAAAYSAHRETPRFAGAPCAWWEMTRPGGDLRRVLGPCKGPYDEQHGAIVGLHRQGSEHLCSHHLRFVRDLGGDLEAELASAAAAREGGLPSPLLAMRIDGAARSMVRERVGRWVQSGFEGGDDHELEALGGDTWRVRTWVVAALEGEEPRRLELELVLTLGDGPHDDTLQSFRFPRKR